MIAHPIVLAVVTADVAAVIMIVVASIGAFRVLLGWRPDHASRKQLELERRGEALSLQGRAASVFFLLASVGLVVAVASVLPGVVPGAMCGTGVVQALGPMGERALWLRLSAILLLTLWYLLDRLNRSCPLAPLTMTSARSLLIVLPVFVLSVIEGSRALLTLDMREPVDCCAALYDAARMTSNEVGPIHDSVPWVWLLVLLSLPVTAMSIVIRRKARSGHLCGRAFSLALAPLSVLWVGVATKALVPHLAAYHYGVLAHDCPWCLFALRHSLMGYPLYGALFVVGLEGGAMALLTIVGQRFSDLRLHAAALTARGALHLVIALVCFLSLALLPALVWRIRHGLWIDG